MIENNSVLKIEKTISLPMVVETHAVLLDWNNELWIFINSVESKETSVFKLNNTFFLKEYTSLPFLITSATLCKKKMVLSGASTEGKPMIIAINNLAEIQSLNNLEIVPTIWPVTACSNKTFIAWQENANEIERGNLNLETSKIDRLPAISVTNPPAIIFPFKEAIFVAISERNKTQLINLISNEISNLDVSKPISIGETMDSFFYGWLKTNTVCLKFLKKDKQFDFPIKKASLGKLKAISGKEATLWIQKREMQMDGEYQWQSLILQENTDVFEIDGFIYQAISWKDRLVLIQNSKIVLLKKSPK